MNAPKRWLAENTNPGARDGTPREVIEGTDLFVGLSGPGIITASDLERMNPDPFVFAMANPNPEVRPEEAAPYVRVMATGRSDYPNQINNVLAFPGVFRGALDARAHRDHRGDEAGRGARHRQHRGRRRARRGLHHPERLQPRGGPRGRQRRARGGGALRRRARRRSSSRPWNAPRSAECASRSPEPPERSGGALVARAARARRRGDRAVARRRARLASLGVPAEQWADPKARAAAGRGAARPRRRRPPARRDDRAALERRRQARDPRLARARDPQPRGGAAGAAGRESDRACWSRSRPPASTGRAATSRWTRAPRPATTSSPRVVVEWEAEAQAAAELGMRVVLTRTGVVLSERAARSRRCCRSSSSASAGRWPAGDQYVPWVHLDDVVGAIAVRARHRGRARAAERDRARAGDQQGASRRARAACCAAPPSRRCPRSR